MLQDLLALWRELVNDGGIDDVVLVFVLRQLEEDIVRDKIVRDIIFYCLNSPWPTQMLRWSPVASQ